MAALVHLTEVLVHGVDLAIAVGRTDLVDQRLCEDVLAQMRRLGIEAFRRPDMFGPERAAPEGTAAHLRLAALLGRAVQGVGAAA
ncbi:hypothetical protein [Streptomyces sp. NPDC053069]|uniref:hypothetical protein n=1 Tax=Streptomyces sp. NPDC053069 TaxID=3365695 RepID=UPI0037CEBE9A